MALRLPEEAGLAQAHARMERALEVARQTPSGDVPVGAVVFDPQGREIATGVNRREERGDPTAHAEMEAIRSAVRVFGDGWRLAGCEIVVTLEPCAMCAGAIQSARLDSVVFGAFEPKTGACGSLVDVLRAPGAGFIPHVRGGVCAEATSRQLVDFFHALR